MLVFLGTGVFMSLRFPDLYAGNETIRFLFRANHVYLLFAGLINILPGLYFTPSESPGKAAIQKGGSWLILIAPVLFFAAFVVEPMQASPMRPLTLTGAFASLIGVGLHALSAGFQQRDRSSRIP